LQFETQKFKSFINLDDYPMLSKPIKQVQTLAKKIHFHWNDDLDCVLIKLLETYSNAPLECIVQLFNSSLRLTELQSISEALESSIPAAQSSATAIH
jgi:hypothetical protein